MTRFRILHWKCFLTLSVCNSPCLRLALLVMLSMPQPAMATEGLTVTKEIVLDGQFNNEPITIARTNDNGFLITNIGSHQAVVRQTDADGNVKWRYATTLLDPPWDLTDGPQYHGAVAMPDGSSFLCGQMPRHDVGFRADIVGHDHLFALLTHLDKDGKLIKDQLLDPQRTSNNVYANNLLGCARSNDGIVTVGEGVRHVPVTAEAGQPPFTVEHLYWFAAFDAEGKLKWETFEPVPERLRAYPDYVDQPQIAADGGFIFLAGRSPISVPGMKPIVASTQVIHVDPSGILKANVIIDGMFRLVRLTTKADSSLQVISLITKPTTLITLNDALQEIKRVMENREAGTIRVAYRLPDQSLFLFGSVNKHPPDSIASISKLDASLRKEQNASFSSDKGATSDWVDDAVPTATSGEFASIRRVVPHEGSTLALDFVRVK
jgi:hypothetical protein